jgi:hypothetical protein
VELSVAAWALGRKLQLVDVATTSFLDEYKILKPYKGRHEYDVDLTKVLTKVDALQA